MILTVLRTRTVRGSGSYNVTANSIIGGRDTIPEFDRGMHGTRVRHREFIKLIKTSAFAPSGATLFDIEYFRLNPAIHSTFPWFGSIAENFSEFRFHGLVFEFKSLSANALNSTNTALGKVVMATQYNVYERNFTNSQFMENTQYSCSGKPSISLLHAVECSKFQNVNSVLYMDDDIAGDDQRFEDLGKFSIATEGMQQTECVIGELWVSYDVELLKPRQQSVSDVYDHFVIGNYPATNGVNYDSHVFQLPPGTYTKENSLYQGVTNTSGFSNHSNFGCTLHSTTTLNASRIELPRWFYGNVSVMLNYVHYQPAVGMVNHQNVDLQPDVTIAPIPVPNLVCLQNTSYHYRMPYQATQVFLPIANSVLEMGCTMYITCSGGGHVVITNPIGLDQPTSASTLGDLYINALPEQFTD